MKKMCHLGRPLIFSIFACLILLLGSQSMGETVQNLPGTLTPFDISRPNALIRVDVKVTEHRPYEFYLNVYYKGRAEQARVIQLVGNGSRYPDGRYGRPGLIVPIHLKVLDSTGVTIDDSVHDVQGVDIHGFNGDRDGYYSRHIHDVVLRPGIYHIEISAMRGVPEYSGISCAIHIGWHPNTKAISN